MTLYIVSVPIGHPDDITLRAIEVFKKVDFLICEEFKEGRKLLKRLDIQNELVNLNEHNEASESDDIIQMLKSGKDGALFTDCGTPLFADPGTQLVNRCHSDGIRVKPVPGASSLMSALAVAGVSTKQFYYAGFLSRKSEERRREIIRLNHFPCAIVIYDTAYRLTALLEDIQRELGNKRSVVLLLSLTKEDEEIRKGTPGKLLEQIKKQPIKKEFVLIVEPSYTKPKKKKPAKLRKRRH